MALARSTGSLACQCRTDPLAQVERVFGSDGEWIAQGDDPQLLLVPERVLRPGWYRMCAALEELEGQLTEPCLYPDYGTGCSEATRLALRYEPGTSGLSCLLPLAGSVSAIRFDPSTQACRFVWSAPTFEPLSREEALWLMFRAEAELLRRRQPSELAWMANHVHQLRTNQGLDAAVRWLWERYCNNAGAQDAAYLRWISNAESSAVAQAQTAEVEGGPLFSVILLPGGTAETVAASVASVARQGYGRVELLAWWSDGLALAPDTSFLRVVNGPVWCGPDSALSQACGQFIAWLQPGDQLHPAGLEAFAEEIESSTQACLLYSDEDFLDADGVRYAPYFKPQWNLDLVRNQDYLGRSVVMERSALQQAVEGMPDSPAWLYDSCLRLADAIDPLGIIHVPRITRHCILPVGPDSEPFGGCAAAWSDAARQAVLAHLQRRGEPATLEREAGRGPWRVRYEIPSGARVDIVIPTKDRVDLLGTCIESILRLTTGPHYHITIVDNRSELAETETYLEQIQRDPRVRVIRYDHPFNYSAINNHAVAQCSGDYVVLLNNDIEVIDGGWLEELISHAARPGVGAVGAKLLYPDYTLQHAGVILGVKGVAGHAYVRERRDYPGYFNRAHCVQSLSAVTAACLAIRRSIFDEVGGLDESLAVAFNDVDFCLRVGACGYRNLWTPYAELIHHESASRGYEDDPVKQGRFASEVTKMQERWGDILEHDPAYSDNLSLSGPPFSIDPHRWAYRSGPTPMDAHTQSKDRM